MTTYTIQEDGLPIVETHIVKRPDTNTEFTVLSMRYSDGYSSRLVEFFMSEAQLMQFSNAVARAVANVRPPLADMDEEQECVLDDGEQNWDESDGPAFEKEQEQLRKDVLELAERESKEAAG